MPESTAPAWFRRARLRRTILHALAEATRPLGTTELSTLAGSARSSIRSTLSLPITHGWVEEREVPRGDGTSHMRCVFTLTDTGRRMLTLHDGPARTKELSP